ncbi:MAG: Stress response protein NhaX [Syntrophorhabdus sp. PtaU1.Bin050]|nr:MAG: Stress response protein NhaX [Syntrophorhabdus sp. PtaU1.Bin050]
MFKPTRILVPTDFSEYSDKALGKALDVAKESGAEVLLLHVIHQDFQTCVVDYCFTTDEIDRIRNGMISSATENIQKELEKFPLSKEVKISTDVKNGIPYEEILKEQGEKDIDLIVIASHGRSGLKKYLMGSVATRVIKGAQCEVLLVK